MSPVIFLLFASLRFRALLVVPLLVAEGLIAAEKLDRGVIAVPSTNGQVYIGWRLLAADPANIAFDLLRAETATGIQDKLNSAPITGSCNFVDTSAAGKTWQYFVRPQQAGSSAAAHPLSATAQPGGFLRLKFDGSHPASKVAIADLDGDGAYDFVIKQPNQVTDPGVWRPSEDSFKLEAYRSDGTFLWRKDLGWNIEQGIWYSPMIVYDLNGDGKAEVAVKTAPMSPDYRNETRRVLDGPEYCSILDGLTGEEITRVDWIPRGNIADWGDNVGNRASRHMLGLAYLDGRTPSLLIHRGTYTTMILEAYNLSGRSLRKIWSWNGDKETPPVRGQGLHGIQVADIDADSRDEIILGSAALDDDGKFLWSTGLGHADSCYVADIDPAGPGLEIIYGIEPRQRSNAICLVEARTGRLIWGFPQPTEHVHSQALFADIDPDHPGMEFYTGEKRRPDRWLLSARTGKLLSTEDLGSLAPIPVYWLDGRVKPFVSREELKLYKGPVLAKIEGRVLAVADILGDWREEIITSLPGELRIYISSFPASTRRTCLMQNRAYRTAVSTQPSAYFYPPNIN